MRQSQRIQEWGKKGISQSGATVHDRDFIGSYAFFQLNFTHVVLSGGTIYRILLTGGPGSWLKAMIRPI